MVVMAMFHHPFQLFVHFFGVVVSFVQFVAMVMVILLVVSVMLFTHNNQPPLDLY